MRIELTQDHINNGLRRSCRQCAVALALEAGLAKPVKVTSQFFHDAKYHLDDISLGEGRLGKIGRKLRFFINDFDAEPKAVRPITMEFKDGLLEIVGSYEPIESYVVHHVPESFHVKGPCGCIKCEFGKDSFTPKERSKLIDHA